jgi:predicted dehydrogenase
MQALREADLVDIVALADPVPDSRERARAIAPEALMTCETVDDLLNVDLDGLVIATPSALHAAQSIAALSAGLAVFAQKPLARSSDETAAVLRAAKAADRLLAVDYSYRHTAAMQAVATEIRSGALGHVYAAQLTFHNAYGPDKPWFYDRALSGGGCLIDLGSHLIDLALRLAATPVRHVASSLFASGRRLEPGADLTEDYATIQLDHEDGAVTNVSCSWRLPAGVEAIITCEWFGTRGGVRMANVNGSFYDFAADRLCGTQATRLVHPPDEWGGRALVEWARTLSRSAAYDPAVEDAMAVASVIDRAYGTAAPAC